MAEDERSTAHGKNPLPSPPASLPSARRGWPEGDATIPTRESLLSRLKDWRDGESWQEFFDTYWRLIYGVARKIEGFRYDPKVCSFKSWMLQLTRWRIINQLKRRAREAGHRPLPVGDLASTEGTNISDRIAAPAGCDFEAIWDAEWEKNLLAAALERVKRQVAPEQFQIFDLVCLEGWPVRKVTETLGVSAARVYLAKHRIGRMLKKELKALEKRPSYGDATAR